MMAENIHDGLIIVEQGRIVFANRRISEITGYSDDELKEMGLYKSDARQGGQKPPGRPGKQHAVPGGPKRGKKIPRIIPEEEQGKIEKIIRGAGADPEVPAEFKVWIERKDGMRRFTHGKVTAASYDGVVSTYIIITDITGFAEKERALQERIESLQELIP
jgi:PAS domain-containing protein